MSIRILHGDCRETLKTLPDESVHCCVTSPPYFGLRDYGCDGQLGLEATPEEFIAKLVEVFREVRRVLRDDGTLWVNMGDSYSTHAAGKVANPMAKSTLAGVKTQEVANESSRAQGAYLKCASLPEKNLIGVPWMLAFALRADGWYLRQDIIWSKPNPMPESVRDRCTKAHEYLFLLSKSPRYYFDSAAMQEPAKPESAARYNYDFGGAKAEHLTAEEANGPGTRTRPIGKRQQKAYSFARTTATEGKPGSPAQHREDREDVAYIGTRNKRSVWEVATQPFAEAHFATFPPALIEPCILAGAPQGGTVLDPFGGAGTTGLVADRLQRDAILCELNPQYIEIAERRIRGDAPLFADIAAA